MANITFVIFTYNEEKRIEYAIKNFKNFGEVLIMDGGSDDNTEKIATELGATFLRRPITDKPFTENQKNLDFIKEHISTDWIYWGYCDNTAPKKLLEKMCELSEQTKYKKVSIPMYTYLWGYTKNHVQESHIPVLFHKDYTDFSNNYIHGFGDFLGTEDEILELPLKKELALCHFSTYNESKFVKGYMRYGEEEAKQKFERKEKFKVSKLFAAMLRYLWIYKRALRNPRLGVLVMLNMSFGRLMTYTRLYELENDITLDSIEDRYSKEKEEILKTF
ncbi:hypothetical protein CL644_02080 [bacterium]|nr:hypothetical protein [bacterium]|tara:strand:+ start:15978 stop:16805 length:828 start_codon:yes stop_codon:yes gene_type:complete